MFTKQAAAELFATEKKEQRKHLMGAPENMPLQVEPKSIPWTLEALKTFGVPHEQCQPVLVLAGMLGANQVREP